MRQLPLILSLLLAAAYPVVPPENSIRVAYRTSGVIAPGFYSFAYIGDVPCEGVA